jgi:hypothetical protein
VRDIDARNLAAMGSEGAADQPRPATGVEDGLSAIQPGGIADGVEGLLHGVRLVPGKGNRLQGKLPDDLGLMRFGVHRPNLPDSSLAVSRYPDKIYCETVSR